jgi:LCP family protein required for cell wall assembly
MIRPVETSGLDAPAEPPAESQSPEPAPVAGTPDVVVIGEAVIDDAAINDGEETATADVTDAAVAAQVDAEVADALAVPVVDRPQPPAAPRRWRRQAGRHGPTKPPHRRRWVKVLAIAATCALLLTTCVAGFAYWYSHHLYDRIRKISLPPGLTRHRSIPLANGASPAGLPGPNGPEPPVNILVVGSDTRSDLNPNDYAHYGNSTQVAGQRSDTIMIMRVGASGVIQAMSIPRDLWVKIPGTRRYDRINTTFNTGPALLVQAIETDLGIPIDYYAEIDFSGFRKVVFALGGINVCFPAAERDSYSGLNITQPGCRTLDPNTALAYVRARHMEIQQPNGRWAYDPTSDFGRMQRQQEFIKEVAAKAQAMGLGNPLRINSILQAVPDAFAIDSRLTFNQMLRLARRFRQSGSVQIDTMTLPATDLRGIYMGGIEAAVLQLQEPQASYMLDTFRDGLENLPPVPRPSRPLARATPY